MYDEHIYDPDEPTEKAILGVGFEEERQETMQIPILGFQVCIICDSVEVSPPEVAGKKGIVAGNPAKSFHHWTPSNLPPF